MAMLDEWDENIDLGPLEPVIEIAGSTSSSFTYSTFGSCFARAAPGMVHLRKIKKPLGPIVSEGRFWEVCYVFLY